VLCLSPLLNKGVLGGVTGTVDCSYDASVDAVVSRVAVGGKSVGLVRNALDHNMAMKGGSRASGRLHVSSFHSVWYACLD
jgi:hypothetical protein